MRRAIAALVAAALVVGCAVAPGPHPFPPNPAPGPHHGPLKACAPLSQSASGADIVNYINACIVLGGAASVGMTMDGIIYAAVVAGSPVTGSGSLIPSLNTEAANTVLSGPATGAAVTPTFRALVAADMPAPLGDVTNTYGATRVTGVHFGATSVPISGTAPTNLQYLQMNGGQIIGNTPAGGGTITTYGPTTVTGTTGGTYVYSGQSTGTGGNIKDNYLLTFANYQNSSGAPQCTTLGNAFALGFSFISNTVPPCTATLTTICAPSSMPFPENMVVCEVSGN